MAISNYNLKTSAAVATMDAKVLPLSIITQPNSMSFVAPPRKFMVKFEFLGESFQDKTL